MVLVELSHPLNSYLEMEREIESLERKVEYIRDQMARLWFTLSDRDRDYLKAKDGVSCVLGSGASR